MLLKTCKKLPVYLTPRLQQTLANLRCQFFWQDLGPFPECSFCINFWYMYNFSTRKICVKKEKFKCFGFKTKSLLKYLRENLLADPFFTFNIITAKDWYQAWQPKILAFIKICWCCWELIFFEFFRSKNGYTILRGLDCLFLGVFLTLFLLAYKKREMLMANIETCNRSSNFECYCWNVWAKKILMLACTKHLIIQLTSVDVFVHCVHWSKKFCVKYGSLCTGKLYISLWEKCFGKFCLKQWKYLPRLIFYFWS